MRRPSPNCQPTAASLISAFALTADMGEDDLANTLLEAGKRAEIQDEFE